MHSPNISGHCWALLSAFWSLSICVCISILLFVLLVSCFKILIFNRRRTMAQPTETKWKYLKLFLITFQANAENPKKDTQKYHKKVQEKF